MFSAVSVVIEISNVSIYNSGMGFSIVIILFILLKTLP
jgi:hypothetical protein